MAQLIIKQGPCTGMAYPFSGDSVTIGRDRSNAICLPFDTVSRAHGILENKKGVWTLKDLKSSNGTRLNGNRVDTAVVHHMDEIQFGELTVLFMDDNPELFAAEQNMPEVTQVLDSTSLKIFSDTGENPAINRSIQSLFKLSTEVSACRSIPELMSKLVETAGETLRADRVVPILLEDGKLRPWYGRRCAKKDALAELPVSSTIVQYVRQHRQGVLSKCQADERFSASESIINQKVSGAICVPLISAGKELGVIYADRMTPAKSFEQVELELLAAMAMPVVVALENIRFSDSLKNEREQMVDRMKLEHNIIGSHESITKLLLLTERVAPSDSSVLICGESGTGKELVAKAIHLNSQRRAGAFEAVNCAALAQSLIESELFGHVKGAFTGAIADKPGRFELANNGTLFLDEVGEMPLDTQAKLLRVIEEGELRRVGDTRDRSIDVRIIAATNKNLEKLTADGKFREDLFYRLNIVRIDIPPLRARGDDIELLIDHYLGKFCKKMGRQLTLPKNIRQSLSLYKWPGNVRELKNLMERLAVICRSDEVSPEDLPPEIFSGSAIKKSAGDKPNPAASLVDVERDHILRVLADCSGNKKEAAGVLGIDRSTLYAKLKQYNIE